MKLHRRYQYLSQSSNFWRDVLNRRFTAPAYTPKVSLAPELSETLESSIDRTKIHSALTPSSKRAYDAARRWMLWSLTMYGAQATPRIGIPGDGSLIVEWESQNGRVSVRFDAEDDDTDLIISRMAGERVSAEFSGTILETQLDQLILDNVPPPTHTLPTESSTDAEHNSTRSAHAPKLHAEISWIPRYGNLATG